MTKQAFMTELEARLAGLPQEDINERLGFYGEMIDDRTEEGIPEDEAVAEIGDIDEIVSQILAEYPLAKIVKEKVKPKRGLRVWEIVLIVVGSPIWLSLLITAFAVVLSLYIVLWALVISLWAVFVSLLLGSLGMIAVGAVYAVKAGIAPGIAAIGIGIFGTGCSILIFFGCVAASKGIVTLTRKMFLGIKSRLIGKERAK